jgi:hypothetical protein
VIGSQALLAQFPAAPDELLESMEADVFPLKCPELAEKVHGAIGEFTALHEMNGYYAHGVAPETSALRRGGVNVSCASRSTESAATAGRSGGVLKCTTWLLRSARRAANATGSTPKSASTGASLTATCCGSARRRYRCIGPIWSTCSRCSAACWDAAEPGPGDLDASPPRRRPVRRSARGRGACRAAGSPPAARPLRTPARSRTPTGSRS